MSGRRFVRPAAGPETPVRLLNPAEYVQRFPAGSRRDQLVLLDLAKHSDVGQTTWGEHAFPSVPAIAARIGYCERSVQYALRSLEADGRLERVERPGRTTVYRIARHLELVSAPAGGASEPSAGGAAVAPGGASVAPDQGLPTGILHPPEPPASPKSDQEPPDGGAHAAPKAPRSPGPTDPASPTAPLAVVAEPHRRMRGPGVPAETAEPSADEDAVGLSELEAAARAPARAMRCPACHALPGRPCTRSSGAPRRRNHAVRVELLAKAEAERELERRRPVEPCPEHGAIRSRTPMGECGLCRSERIAGD